MKKFLSALVASALVVAPMTILETYADGDLTIKAETVPAKPGSSIEVAVEISDNPGIVSMGFDVIYDADSLVLTKVDDCSLIAGYTPSQQITENPYFLSWSDDLALENNTENGKLVVLHFDVLDTAKAGFSEIAIDVKHNYVVDFDLNEVAFKSVNGGVEIKGEETTTTTTTVTTTTTTKPTTTTTTSTTTTAKPTTTTTTSTTTTAKPTTTTTTSTTTTAKPTTTTTTSATTTAKPTTTTTSTTNTTETTTTETTTEETELTTTTTEVTTITEETTTVTTETSTDITTEPATTTKAYFAPVDDMSSMAIKDYKKKTGVTPAKAETFTNEDGTITIVLTDSNGKLLDTYIIDPVTGKGKSKNGKEVNLPQTGNNSMTGIAVVTTGAALILSGTYVMLKSGVIRRKKDDEEV